MFKEAARIKKEMEELIETTAVLGIDKDNGVHMGGSINYFVSTALKKGLTLTVEAKGDEMYPFRLSFEYYGVSFFTWCTYYEYEENKDLIKKATE